MATKHHATRSPITITTPHLTLRIDRVDYLPTNPYNRTHDAGPADHGSRANTQPRTIRTRSHPDHEPSAIRRTFRGGQLEILNHRAARLHSTKSSSKAFRPYRQAVGPLAQSADDPHEIVRDRVEYVTHPIGAEEVCARHRVEVEVGVCFGSPGKHSGR